MARKKQIEILQPIDIEPMTEFVSFELPKEKETCQFIEEDKAEELISILHNQARII